VHKVESGECGCGNLRIYRHRTEECHIPDD
jgi:hypothetical protein